MSDLSSAALGVLFFLGAVFISIGTVVVFYTFLLAARVVWDCIKPINRRR